MYCSNTVTKDNDSVLNYSDDQLRALYSDLFATPTQPLIETPEDAPSKATLQVLSERFNLEAGETPAYKAVIDRVQAAIAFISPNETTSPQLGLVLDSEWEDIIIAAVRSLDNHPVNLLRCHLARCWRYGLCAQRTRSHEGLHRRLRIKGTN